MSHWSNTTFIRLPHPKAANLVFTALRSIFGVDGYHPLDDAPEISRVEARLMQYSQARKSPLWAAAFIPGKGDWHVIKTAPFSLLARPIRRGLVPRLSHLTCHLNCHGLFVSVTDTGYYFTLETDSESNCVSSGWTIDDADYEFVETSDDAMDEDNTRLDRKTLSYSTKPFLLRPDFNDALRPIDETLGEQMNDVKIATDLTGLEEEEWDNGILVEYLILGKRIPITGAKSWYFRRDQ